MKHCLSIAGSDCSGGAGVQADLKTFSALGAFGMSVITSVVAENTSRVVSVHDVPESVIEDQIDAVFEDIRVDAIKVGMLSGESAMRAVAEKLSRYQRQSPFPTVVDPVMVAKGGCALMAPEALDALKMCILPLAFVLTPNIPEAEAIVGKSIRTEEERKEAVRAIHALGAKHVLLKGGHLEGDAEDLLYDGTGFVRFPGKRIATKNTHGTGCTLSSAIAVFLAKGLSPAEAVGKAKDYVTNAIRHSLEIGKGHGPTNHFYDYYGIKGWLENENRRCGGKPGERRGSGKDGCL